MNCALRALLDTKEIVGDQTHGLPAHYRSTLQVFKFVAQTKYFNSVQDNYLSRPYL